MNVALISQLIINLPVNRLSLRGCNSLSAKDARDLVRHVSTRNAEETLVIDIRDTPASEQIGAERRRLESLALRSRVSLQIH